MKKTLDDEEMCEIMSWTKTRVAKGLKKRLNLSQLLFCCLFVLILEQRWSFYTHSLLIVTTDNIGHYVN